MSQNRSSAVMNQKHDREDFLEDYPTPPWATRALMELLADNWPYRAESLLDWTAREPCANRLHMVKPLQEYFDDVRASDIFDYGEDYPLMDYLFPGMMMEAEATFMNPPFKLAHQFIERSFQTPSWRMTAALVRTNFLEGETRYRKLWSVRPPTIVAHFAERVVMVKGRLLDPDIAVWDHYNRKLRKPATATAYCWLVWIKDVPPMAPMWIPPCRRKLTRPGDYPPLTDYELPPHLRSTQGDMIA